MPFNFLLPSWYTSICHGDYYFILRFCFFTQQVSEMCVYQSSRLGLSASIFTRVPAFSWAMSFILIVDLSLPNMPNR